MQYARIGRHRTSDTVAHWQLRRTEVIQTDGSSNGQLEWARGSQQSENRGQPGGGCAGPEAAGMAVRAVTRKGPHATAATARDDCGASRLEHAAPRRHRIQTAEPAGVSDLNRRVADCHQDGCCATPAWKCGRVRTTHSPDAGCRFAARELPEHPLAGWVRSDGPDRSRTARRPAGEKSRQRWRIRLVSGCGTWIFGRGF